MNIEQVIYTEDLPLLQREDITYRAFIFNKTLRRVWPQLFKKILQTDESGKAYLDYFLLSEEIKLSEYRSDHLLCEFYSWLLNGGECPMYISYELDIDAKQYSVNCIKQSLGEILGSV